MRCLQIVLVVAVSLLMISALACSGGPTTVAPPTNAPAAAAPTAVAPTVGETAEKEFEDFYPNNFARSTLIDNKCGSP